MAKLELDDIQGLLARGYGRLRAARFLVLRFGEAPAARAWLGATAAAVTPATEDPHERALQLALTSTGLQKLGLTGGSLHGLSNEFHEGMTTPHRQRVLGDFNQDDPSRWRWGGTATPPVDAVLMLYTANEEQMTAFAAERIAELAHAGIELVTSLDATDIGDIEPFGFRDGISQPVAEGIGREGRSEDTLKPGEFVLGYPNEYGLLTDRPLVEPADDQRNLLPRDSAGSNLKDLGRNGSYLVIRQLEQNVPAFWKFMEEAARSADGQSSGQARTLLAAKMVGRWPGGASLALSPERDAEELAKENNFGYHRDDADGLRCPIGSHARRANPRDSLDPDPGSEDSIALNKRHRILRRGRAYGPLLPPNEALTAGDDGIERGLHFACLAGNIARQFEFIQHTWANNPKFDELYDEVDPIMGPRGESGATFSIPSCPVRKRVTGIPTFVTVRGGAYFFLPGLRALRYLASLS
jgi:Dyp-type peroxidase family